VAYFIPTWGSSADNGPDINGPTPYRIPSPIGVTAEVTGANEFMVKWADAKPVGTRRLIFDWFILYCGRKLAGSPSGRVDWNESVAKKASIVGAIPSLGTGQQLSYTHRDTSLPDGYVQIQGISDSGIKGRPSTPVPLQITGNTGGIPDLITALDLTLTKERIPRDVLRIDGLWYPPNDRTELAGLQLYLVGYNGESTPRELGSMTPWSGSSGTNYLQHRLPVETGFAQGTALFTNGSAAVVRATGPTFITGTWNGHSMIADLDAQTSSATYKVLSVSDADHLTLTSNFQEATGTYSFIALNITIAYFVAVGKSGARTSDYTATDLQFF